MRRLLSVLVDVLQVWIRSSCGHAQTQTWKGHFWTKLSRPNREKSICSCRELEENLSGSSRGHWRRNNSALISVGITEKRQTRIFPGSSTSIALRLIFLRGKLLKPKISKFPFLPSAAVLCRAERFKNQASSGDFDFTCSRESISTFNWQNGRSFPSLLVTEAPPCQLTPHFPALARRWSQSPWCCSPGWMQTDRVLYSVMVDMAVEKLQRANLITPSKLEIGETSHNLTPGQTAGNNLQSHSGRSDGEDERPGNTSGGGGGGTSHS